MKNFILLSFCLILTISSFGQETETRSIESFDQIKVNSVIKVDLYQGTPGEIEIYADNIPLDKVKSSVRNGKLVLDIESRRKGWNDIEVMVKVPFQTLDKIECRTASSVTSSGKLKFDDLRIKLSEAGNCDLDLDCNSLEVDLNSASHLDLAGTCKKLEANINSASSLNAFGLTVNDADIFANSMGKAKINVKNDLHIVANSMAKVTYMGEPNKLHKNKGSMASIKNVSSRLKEISR